MDDDFWGCVIPIAFLGGMVLLFHEQIMSFVVLAAPWAAGILFLGIGLIFFLKIKERRDDAIHQRDADLLHAKQLAEREQREREREAQAKANAVRAIAWEEEFAQLLTPCLVIDSNIWMNELYDPFFYVLSSCCDHTGYKLSLAGIQFDEIANINKTTKHEHPKSRAARIATYRIESLQKAGFLTVDQITIDAKKKAYADPTIIQLLKERAESDENCTLISQDRELRIRAREFLSDHKTTARVVEMDSILLPCIKYVVASLVLGKEPPPGTKSAAQILTLDKQDSHFWWNILELDEGKTNPIAVAKKIFR